MRSSEPAVPTGIADLAGAVESLELRVAALEARIGLGEDSDLATERVAPAAGAEAEEAVGPASWLAALGRMMLVLAGGFLLRSLTDAGAVQGRLGVALGLLYVLLCIRLTERSARRADLRGASLLGAASALVGYPLLWETAVRLDLLPAGATAAFLALVTAMGLSTSVRHRLWALGWVYVTACLATAAGLAWLSGAPVLFGAEIVALGAATAHLAQVRNWWGPRWPAALVANGLVLLLVVLAAHGGEPLAGRPDPGLPATVALAIALPLVYLGLFGGLLWSGRRSAGPFEIVQSAGAATIGILGAAFLLRAAGQTAAPVGWAVLVVAAGSQAVALRRMRGARRRGNGGYFAGLGLGLAFLGTGLVTPGAWLPRLWAVLGVASAMAAGIRPGRWFLRLQSVVYLGGAAAAGGLALAAAEAFVGRPRPLPGLGIAGVVCWPAAVLGFWLLARGAQRPPAAAGERLLRFLVGAMVVAGGWALAVSAMGAWLGDWAGPLDTRLAAGRTFLLATIAVAAAAASRLPRLAEFGWFVGPCLVLCGLKLPLQDLRHGTPASLFFGFACFGLALLAAPRLRRRNGGDATGGLHQDPAAVSNATDSS